MKLESKAFLHESLIPAVYTCDGEDRIPGLTISDVPVSAISLALIMDDPDVPANIRPECVWDHWLVWNISPQTTTINESQEPSGVIGNNSGGKKGYMGPCPPDREHRYYFRLYALDTMLDTPQSASKDELLQAIQGHVLEKAELMGRYNRPVNKEKS